VTGELTSMDNGILKQIHLQPSVTMLLINTTYNIN
jgi:hypothetical protein